MSKSCANASSAAQPSRELPASVRPQVYVILPAYNESACVEQVVRQVRTLYPNVILVDDGSQDDTAKQARQGGAVVLRHPINRGQGAALQTGIDFALSCGAQYLVTFDSDGQHCVEDIDRVAGPVFRGEVDITLGSRFLGEALDMPWTRRWLLKCGVLFTQLVSGARITDVHNGLRGFSRRAAEKIRITLDSMAHASELIDQVHRCGLPYREVPVRIRYTEYSRGKGQRGSASIRILFHYLFGRVS
jgi:glycosyltransferase involved in cell wall biosynthesis